ncbi:MAG: CBM96 family carbohydrate-binding protein [Candidatus Bathyarchaeaceae archaeon]
MVFLQPKLTKLEKPMPHLFFYGFKMKHKYALAFLLLIFIHQFASIPSTNAVETTTILEPIADATVSNGMEPLNNTELKVGRLNNTMWFAYIMFDLNVSFTDLRWAKLKLRVKDFMHEGNRWVSAHNASTEWREDEITWSNQPERNIPLSMEEVNSIEEWFTLYCGLAVSLIGKGKLSIALTLEPPDGSNGYVVFYSRESEHKPQLEVKYTPPPKIEPILIVAIAGISLSGVLYLAYRLRKRKTKP